MYIHIKVHPGEKKELVKQTAPDQFELFVKESARQNLANDRVRELIAIIHGVGVGKVKLVKGHRSRKKLIEIVE